MTQSEERMREQGSRRDIHSTLTREQSKQAANSKWKKRSAAERQHLKQQTRQGLDSLEKKRERQKKRKPYLFISEKRGRDSGERQREILLTRVDSFFPSSSVTFFPTE